MTKAGPNGPKARARRRQANDETPYTLALRNPGEQHAGAAGPLTYLRGTSPIAWDAPRTWRCFNCGATGEESAGNAGSLFVLEDGVTYLRGHCRSCLSEPDITPLLDSPHGQKHPQWARFGAEALRLDRALSDAAYLGVALRAAKTDAFVCSVCGRDWAISRRVVLPVEKAYTNSGIDEHPCPTCVASLDSKKWRAAHRRRRGELSGPNPDDYEDGEEYEEDRARWAGQDY